MKTTVILMRPAYLTTENQSFNGWEGQDIVVIQLDQGDTLSNTVERAQHKAFWDDKTSGNHAELQQHYVLLAVFEGHPELLLLGRDT